MTVPGSVTVWLDAFKQRDPEAARRLFGRYHLRAQGLARQRLGGSVPRGHTDEDVASQAFADLFFSAGRYDKLRDRGDLWRLLSCIVARRVATLLRPKHPDCADACSAEGPAVARGLAPDAEVACSEECARLLAALTDEQRTVALLALEGFTNEEAADELRRHEPEGTATRDAKRRYVERVRKAIRAKWEDLLA